MAPTLFDQDYFGRIVTEIYTARLCELLDSSEKDVPDVGLFRVWMDSNGGVPPAWWWWETPGPVPLEAALEIAAQLRADHWIVMVLPEGENPRDDGRWDNPA